MIIGIPKEIKTLESRVAFTAGAVETLTRRGHTVLVEAGAGLGSGIADAQYAAAGAKRVDAATAWSADLVVKVKEPVASEYKYLRKGLLLFTYLHLAADRALTDALLASGTTGIAYETVQLPDGTLPLLVPMSDTLKLPWIVIWVFLGTVFSVWLIRRFIYSTFGKGVDAISQDEIAAEIMGGYNTLCEILSQGRPSLVVPRETPRLEQRIRAEMFCRQGLVEFLPWVELSPETLRHRLARLLEAAGPYREAMGRAGVGSVVVADADDKPQGLFTSRDALALLAAGRTLRETRLVDCLHAPVVAVSPQMSLDEVLDGMP